jgi:hypothetical protein
MNKDDIDYIVIDEGTPTALRSAVTKYLKQGWRLVGGVCVAKDFTSAMRFYQAMTLGGKQAEI